MIIEGTPEGVRNILSDHMADEATITMVSFDWGYSWIIEPNLKDWYTIVQWCEGSDQYDVVNIEGTTAQKLLDLMEINGLVQRQRDVARHP